ncbi:MAG: hypothetical protein JRF15_10300 [Deltaproteobacteria bacterium]|jgi:hypothetical protein|nr:hypothetical protein [Deltaproteobacteria bacterium]
MAPRSKQLCIWLAISALVALIAIPLWGPMRIAWHCYQLHENAAREQAEVVEKLPNETFALRVIDGPHVGEVCTADTSVAIYDATEIGESLEVVYVAWKPGECELSSTVEASGWIIWFMVAVIGSILAGLIALGVTLSRSFTLPVNPKRRMRADPAEIRCHVCGEAMEEGYLPLVSAIQWREIGEPIGLPHALKGLAGTVGWRGRPRLHAFRCSACEVVSFQYGKPSDDRPGQR